MDLAVIFEARITVCENIAFRKQASSINLHIRLVWLYRRKIQMAVV
ncbi:MAG: hypothetical protein PWR14_656 [Thermosediminibacterales bacterium]|jgi:hypothetical protein|nr:hypothetical protein [Thermosediminibacterales bacterium]